MCYWVRLFHSSSISREVLVAGAASIADALIRERNGLIREEASSSCWCREEAFLPPISIYSYPITSACFQSILRQVSHDNAMQGREKKAKPIIEEERKATRTPGEEPVVDPRSWPSLAAPAHRRDWTAELIREGGRYENWDFYFI